MRSFTEFSKNKALALFLEAQGAFSSSEGAGRQPGACGRLLGKGEGPGGRAIGTPCGAALLGAGSSAT